MGIAKIKKIETHDETVNVWIIFKDRIGGNVH